MHPKRDTQTGWKGGRPWVYPLRFESPKTIGGKDTTRVRVDGRSDSLRSRSGRVCHNHAVRRFTGSTISGFIMRRNGITTLKNGKGEFPSLRKDGTVMRCKSRERVPIVTVLKKLRTPDVSANASSDRLQITGVRASGDRSRKFPQSDVSGQENSGQASGDRLHFSGGQAPGDGSHNVPEWLKLFELPDSHNVVVEHLLVGPSQKTLDELKASSRRRVNRSSSFRSKVQETTQTQNTICTSEGEKSPCFSRRS